jgi:type I restriction enzyme S subunit
MKQRRISTAQDSITQDAVKSSATNMIAKNSVLLVTRSGILRHSLPVATNTKPVTLNQDMKALTPLEGVSSEYLYFSFLRFERDILHNCCKGGTTVQSIEASRLMSFEIPIPPVNEQGRIVAKIEELFSELDKGIENLKQARAQLAVYRQALLKHAFEGKLTADWRATHAAQLESADQLLTRIRGRNLTHMRAKDAEILPLLPTGWTYTYLSNVGDLARGKSKHRPRNAAFLFGGPYPFIQTGEVKAAERVIRTYEATYSQVGLEQSKLWPKGTLCITIAANIAETAFLGFDACFPDSIVGFTAYDGAVEPEFIDLFIQAVRTRIEAYAPATAQKNINLTTLENLVVPLAPLAEQKELISTLAAQLSMISQTDSDIDTNLQKAEALRQSILKKAFAGELVPQDPADEPAAALLARIRAERVATPKATRRKVRLSPSAASA